MQAAEHGATFPMAKKVAASMTKQQLHDFAAGSERGKPQHVKKTLHPALKQRAAMVKQSHAHLIKTVPGFAKLPGHQQLKHTQAHVSKRLKGGFY